MAGQHELIIVGAGTAGCVLAERLTRSGRHRVLLVEAGGAPTNRFIALPAGMAKLFKSEVDWNLESEPQLAVHGRRIYTPRGRMLGGSANMNAQMHQWCHPADFDGWVSAGASGWGWHEVAPVFRAQEHFLGDDGDSGRGRAGPMFVTPNHNARAISRAFVDAARGLGLGDALHYNGHAYQGAWIAELAHRDGRRFSAYDAFLKPALGRANLEVLTEAQVTRVLVEEGRAHGVCLRRGGPGGPEETHRAATVALAAGTYASPQLLMLSGIGPSATLAALGLPVRVDRAEVGANLQDHPVVGMVFGARGRDTFKSAESLPSVLAYLLFKRGMLASSGVEGFAFTKLGPGPGTAPDLEVLCLPFEHRREFLEPPEVHAFTLAAAVVAPRSRGRVFLRGADPMLPPGIDPGLLGDAEGVDARVLCDGLRLCRRIAAAAPLAAHGTGELRPGPDVRSDADLIAYAGTGLQTVYHPTSTCRMGNDAGAVVDPMLRVRGVPGLWVADASVMPTVPRGHPNAVVAMIAQRAAGWIAESLGG